MHKISNITYKAALLLSVATSVFGSEPTEEKAWRFGDAGMGPALALQQKHHGAPAVQKGKDAVVLDSIYMDPSKRMSMEEYVRLFAPTHGVAVQGATGAAGATGGRSSK